MFRFYYLEKTIAKSKSDEVKKRIIETTGGHGKLVRLSYEAVISEHEKIENLEDFLLKRPTIQGALYEIWNAL
jgi:hypothetical protein